MIQRLAVPSLLALFALAGAPARGAEPATAERPITALPYTPSLDPSVMDRSVDPCADLFKFSCGKWLDKNPIPADRPRWSVYAKMGNDNQRVLWGLLEEAARPNPGRDANTQKIGDYFASCMDEPAIEKAGLSPLRPELAAIAGLTGRPDRPPAPGGGLGSPALRLRLRPGPAGRLEGHRLRGSGRPEPAFARGLRQDRRQVQGDPRPLPCLPAEAFRAAGRSSA